MHTTAHETGYARRAWNFTRHLVEMVAVMCISGGLLLAASYRVASELGAPTFAADAPIAAVLVTALVYASTMVIWMPLRGMPLRATAEMAGSTLAVGGVLIVLGGTGVLTGTQLSHWADASYCMPACVLMSPVMAARWSLYASHGSNRAAQSSRLPDGATTGFTR